MSKATPYTLEDAFSRLRFAGDRTPASTDLADAFCQLAEYRDGGVFLASWAGESEWERHPQGDQVVMVVEGQATLLLLIEGQEVPHVLRAGQLIVVPQNTWHRFESPEGVKVMTITPQPTEHSIDRP